jgi:hypothetical protein
VPATLAGWFISPDPGGAAYETVGVMTFAASIAAAVSGYGFVRAKSGRRGVLRPD